LTAIDGTKYFFGNGQHQSTEVNNGERFYDTWFLDQIVSADGIHQINFNYTPSNYVFYSKQDCHSTHYFDGGQQEAENTCDRDDYNFIEVFGRVLSSITSSYQTITFSTSDRDDLVLHSGGITPKKIDRIGFSDGSHCVEYELTQSYYQDNNTYPNFYFVGENFQQNLSQNTNQPLRKRLRLDQIQKVSCVAGSNDTEEPYVFSYHHTNNYFPCLLSKRINHWGFYNGATINDNLIDLTGPSSVQTPSGGYHLYHGSADRRTDEEAMKTGMLYKVTYPTKGFTQLNYEANRYADYETNQQSVNNFPIETCSVTNSSACCVDISPATTQEITILLDGDMIATGEIYLTVQNDGTEVNCTPGHNFARVNIYDSANNYVDGFSANIYGVHDEETIQKNIQNDFPQLTTGTYKFVLEASFARGELDIRYTPNYTEELAGGFRIKEIITGEGAAPDNDKDIKRTFTYQLDNGTPSGALVNKPTYGFIIDESIYENFGHTGIFTSTGVLPLSGSDGNHIYYRQVNEYFNGNGHKKYTIFYAPTNDVPKFPVAPAKFIAKNGTLDKEKVYKEDGTLELTKNIFDSPINNTTQFITGVKHRSIRIKLYDGTSVIDEVTSADYTMHTGIYRPDGVTTTIDGVTSTTDYDYHSDNNLILPPTKITTTNSDGKVTEITTSYSVDYDGDGSIKNYFTTNNIIGIPYKTEKRVDGELLDGTRTIYSSFGGFPRPASTERYERTWASNGQLMGGEWKPQELFLNYNSAGLLSQYQKIGWSTVVYYYNAQKLLTSQNYALRTTTYDYYPNSSLLQKKTNVDSTSMSYTYDDLMRLSTVTDDNTGAVTTTTYQLSPGIGQKIYTETTASFPADPNNLSQLTSLTSRQYVDGLGRPIQTIEVGQGPNGKDLISTVAYDKHGRSKYSYETIEGALTGGLYINPTMSWEKSTVAYYDSPLNRTQSTTPTDWFATITTYGSNTTSQDGTITNPVTNQAYGEGKLFKQTTTDPDNLTTTTFTDLKGRLILSRRIDDAQYDTYYVYDDKDRLIEVIPPGSAKGNAALNYFYQYDGEDKVVRKKVPAKAWINYRYDDKDLLMAEQDGYLLNHDQWYVYQYDIFGRTTKSGFRNNATPPTDANNPTVDELLHEQIYEDIFSDPQINWGKLKTAKTKVLGTNNWLTSHYTYDSAGRVQSVSSNNHLRPDLADLVENFYDGASNVVKTKTIISTASTSNTIENITHIGANGRTTSEWLNFNGQLKQLCAFTYTAKDELATKYVGGNSSNYLQKVDYEYLENGLLYKVNGGNASGGDLFGYELNYHQTPSITGSATPTPRKNGNISAIKWAQVGQAAQLDVYTYDDLNRLTSVYTPNGEHNTSYAYDVRGNITDIDRYGLVDGVTTLIDDLHFHYKAHNANILDKVTDDGLVTEGYKSSHPDLVYDYDDNGNLMKDPHKGVTITYNYLDLPEEVRWSASKKLRFTYDAGGTLLKKEVIHGVVTTEYDYIGPIEYENGEAHIVHHAEGRIVRRKPDGSNDGLVLSGPLSQNQQYNAPTIASTNVLNGGLIAYEAGEGIHLKAGFHTGRNATLHALIGDSGPSSPVQWLYEWDVRDHLGNLRMT
ncbi:MAG: DUF6443 domain-containing protein, partial [Bacteroidota bacterium]